MWISFSLVENIYYVYLHRAHTCVSLTTCSRGRATTASFGPVFCMALMFTKIMLPTGSLVIGKQ